MWFAERKKKPLEEYVGIVAENIRNEMSKEIKEKIKDWEKEFEKTWYKIDNWWEGNKMKSFIHQLLKKQKEEILAAIKKKIKEDRIVYCTQHTSNNEYKTCEVCRTGELIQDRILKIIEGEI